MFKREPIVNSRLVREAVNSHGPEAVAQSIVDNLWAKKIRPEQLSIRGLWEGLVGPCEDTLQEAARNTRGFIRARTVEEVRSQAFSFVTGNIVMNAIMGAYEERASTLNALVTTMGSAFRVEPITGFQSFGGLKDTPEGQEYEDVTFTDKVVMSPEPTKRGRMVSITQETILFDRTGQVLQRAQELGRDLADDREFRGIKKIQDSTGYKCYYPVVDGSPVQTALYRSSAGSAWYNQTINLKTTNALVDWTDVDAALQLFDGMENEAGRKIVVNPNTILVPRALLGTALRVVNATEVREVTATNTTTVGPNVVTLVGGPLSVLWSPFMDDSTSWYIGDPRRQFIDRVIIPGQVLEIAGDPRRDIVTSFLVRHKSQVEAIDDKFFVKSTS